MHKVFNPPQDEGREDPMPLDNFLGATCLLVACL